MKRSHLTAVFSMALATVFLMGACAPAATPGTPVLATVIVTSPPQVVTQIVNGTPQTIEITSTPGPTAAPEATALPAGSITLNGAGATFPDPIYTEWRFAYQFVDPSVVINYQAIGSGGGQKAIEDGTVDFAGSDSLLPTTVYTTPTFEDLQMFPTVAGAIVAMYNIQEVTAGLTLDGPTLVGIYQGKINMWNDPAIAALNAGVTLPAEKITAVHRSDGSGTTDNFTKFLSDASPDDWGKSIGHGNSVQWPVDKSGNGVGGKGNAGVAAAVQNTPYSVGYVELSYAVANKIPFADMINAAGKKVTANHDSLVAAMADFGDKFTDRLTIDRITNAPGAGSWPISTYTYMIVHMNQKADATWGCTKVAKYLDFVHWALSDAAAAKRATDLGYATLPDTVQKKVFAKLASVQCDGKPVSSDMSQ